VTTPLYKKRFCPVNFNNTTLLIGIALFLASFVFYLLNAFHLSPLFFASNHGPFFGADTVDISNNMRVPTLHMDMRKHLLFSVVTESLVDVVGLVFRLSEDRAIMVSLGIMSAANVTLAWWILKRFVTSLALATALAVAYGLTFSNIVFFSIPETYSVSNWFILTYFALLLAFRDIRSPWSAVALGAAAGVAGLFNPTLLSLSLVGVLYRWRWDELKGVIGYGVLTLLVALPVCILPYAYVHGMENVEYVSNYTNEWASISNLFDIREITLVTASFLLFSVVSPYMELAKMIDLNDLLGYAQSPLAIATLLLYLGIGLATIGQAVRHSDRLVLAILVWLGVMLAFFIYFNPRESLLYSSQVLFPLVLLAARGLVNIPLPDRYKTALVASLAVLLALTNIPVLYSDI